MRAPQLALIAATSLTLGGLWLRSSVAATPAIDPGAFAHCASITAADERLACYDSLGRPKPASPAAATAAPTRGTATPHPATTPGAASTAAATAAPAAATAGAAAAGTAASATHADAEKSFGLTKHTAPTEQGPERIDAQATRVDTDRLGNVRVSLDNGQVWIFNAPEALIRVGDTLTIKRGALGSFLLTTPEHHTYKAQRSK
jgi:hypothetical protein